MFIMGSGGTAAPDRWNGPFARAKHRFSGLTEFYSCIRAIMRRSLPPLNALRSFDAAARHQSFTRAAEELCVTQGAVSHQIKALESELGVQLFKRRRNGLVITDAGRDYLAVVHDVFDRLELGTD